MSIKVAINGFGRIGRLALRAGLEMEELEFVGINHPGRAPELMAYMFKYDSAQGTFPGEVTSDDSSITVNGKRIPFFSCKDPKDIPWASVGAEYVIESSGKFLTKELSAGHLEAGAKKVIMSAPSKDDTPMFVMGVNNELYTSDMNFVSNASCTTNCLAPLAKVINDNFGIESGLMATVHSITSSQNGRRLFQQELEAGQGGFLQHNPRLHRRRQGCRQGHSRAQGQADRYGIPRADRRQLGRRSYSQP